MHKNNVSLHINRPLEVFNWGLEGHPKLCMVIGKNHTSEKHIHDYIATKVNIIFGITIFFRC